MHYSRKTVLSFLKHANLDAQLLSELTSSGNNTCQESQQATPLLVIPETVPTISTKWTKSSISHCQNHCKGSLANRPQEPSSLEILNRHLDPLPQVGRPEPREALLFHLATSLSLLSLTIKVICLPMLSLQ